MRRGDIIKGYTILEDFTTAGGGLSKWTFARRLGKDYFIKEFLAPTYPTPDGPGSPKSKAQKKARCDAFERHHQTLMDKLDGRSSEGGNLVVTADFFRYGAKYYKVTDKVEVTGLKPKDVAKLPWKQQRLILLTVSHSLKILHTAGVVHGDLKPDNILIKEKSGGQFVTKLIDFDNSYVSGNPPSSDEIVGDQVYYSPELLRYVTKSPDAKAGDLELRSDTFALGLIYTEYLTGAKPDFDQKRYHYACEAVNDGASLTLPAAIVEPIRSLVARMLAPRPDQRPTISEVFDSVKASRPTAIIVPPPRPSGPLMKKTSRDGGPPADAVRPPMDLIVPMVELRLDPAPKPKLSGTLTKKKP